MKTFNFSKDSWHYELVHRYTDYRGYYDELNICAYTRAVLTAIIGAVLCSTMILLVLYLLLVNPIVMNTLTIVYGYVPDDPFMVMNHVGSCITIVLILIGTISYINEKYLAEVNYDKFVPTAYKSFKDKFCARIDFN